MQVIVYSKTVCPYCVQAKQFLKRNSITFQEVNLDDDAARLEFYNKVGDGVRSVPQIFFGDERIGGYGELLKSDLVNRYNLNSKGFNEAF